MKNASLFNYSLVEFDYVPYPIGIIHKVIEQTFYEELVESFPPKQLFAFKPDLGNKYSLSQINNPREYYEFISSSKPWKKMYEWIKSPEFIDETISMLMKHNIDLGLNLKVRQTSFLQRFGFHKQGKSVPMRQFLSARFEFSMLPAAGGHILPHTDSPQKIITLVLSMLKEGEWKESFGGGTEVLEPLDIRKNFNFVNNYLDFSEVRVIKTFEYKPNQCVVFVKTFNSLHAVRSMTGESDKMRKTLTINIENTLITS